MFLEAFLKGYTEMVKTSKDIDRLKLAPQRVEKGVFYNFRGDDMFKGAVEGFEELDQVIIDTDRISKASRFTSALQKEYFGNLDALLTDIRRLDPNGSSLEDRLLECVEASDRKGFRALRKELKEFWSGLDKEDIFNAILDLADAVIDKDLEFAKEILEGMTVEDPEKEAHIEDLTSAVEDKDIVDTKEVAEKIADTLPEGIVGEIVEDLVDAIEKDDKDEVAACLEELLDELGEEDSIYKKYAEKAKAYLKG